MSRVPRSVLSLLWSILAQIRGQKVKASSADNFGGKVEWTGYKILRADFTFCDRIFCTIQSFSYLVRILD